MNSRQTVFAPLLQRSSENAQVQHLTTHYDLSRDSRRARAIVRRVNDTLDKEEGRRQIRRLRPGELLLGTQRGPLVLPIRTEEDIQRFISGARWVDVRRDILRRCLARYEELFPEASRWQKERFLRTLWYQPPRSTTKTSALWASRDSRPWADCKAQREPLAELDRSRAKRRYQWKPPRPTPRPQTMRALCHYLGAEAGVPPAVQEPLVLELMSIRARFQPRLGVLQSGQMPLAAMHVDGGRSLWQASRYQPLAPVLVKILAERETHTLGYQPPEDYANYLLFEGRRIARVLTDAYVQNGLLSFAELQWIFLLSTGTISRVVDYYQKQKRVILPCPGTVLDQGRMLTHKALIIRLHLQGMTVLEIARQTYHHPRSVDAYIKSFEAVLILHLYGLPLKLMVAVLGRGPSLIQEYLNLINEYLKDPEEIRNQLRQSGLQVPALQEPAMVDEGRRDA